VNRRSGVRAAALERDLEQPRIGFLHAEIAGVEDAVHVTAQAEAVHVRAQRPVRVRHDRRPKPARGERFEHRDDPVRNELPEILLAVVLVQLGQRGGGRVR